MIKERNNRWTRAVLTLVMAALLVVAGLAPSSSLVYSQQRTARRPQTNQRSNVYDRSYLKGYNEGFGQGQADWSQGSSRDFQRSDQYQQRDRSNEQGRGSSGDYTQGYQLGLELGYSDGYYGRTRNTAVPANALALFKPAITDNAEPTSNRKSVEDSWDKYAGSRRPGNYPPISVPENTEMRLKLTSPLNTKTNRVGDSFTAVITSPSGYEGATIEGHIANLNRSGRITGKTELTLAFDSITLLDRQQGPINASLERILMSEQVKKVNEEGRIESGSRTRDSKVRGGEGALMVLIQGGAAGVGTVYVEGNNDLILDNGTEMVIRTVGRNRR